MSQRVQRYREKAEACERLAAQAKDDGVKASFDKVAQQRPESSQFRLQVDRQTKASYTTLKAAEEAGLAIKNAYPFLKVGVHDAAEGVNKIIELPHP